MRIISALLALVMSMLVAAPSWAAPYTSKTTTLKNSLSVLGGLTLGTPLTIGNVNNAVKSNEFDINISGATTSSTTYRNLIAPGRASTLTKVSIAVNTVPAGGTCTLAVKKNNGNTMLSAATFNMTTLTANLVADVPLTAVAADLALTATDSITVEVVTGTLSTQANSPGIMIEMVPTVDY